MEFERTERTVVSYKQIEEALPLLEKVAENPGVKEALAEQGLRLAPEEISVEFHVKAGSIISEAITFLEDNDFLVYKKHCGRAVVK